jgi:hypothetical protein
MTKYDEYDTRRAGRDGRDGREGGGRGRAGGRKVLIHGKRKLMIVCVCAVVHTYHYLQY